MSTFSRRYKYNVKDIQLECASEVLKNRIFAAFYKQEFDIYDSLYKKNYTTGIEDMMIQMGITYDFPQNVIYKTKNAKALEDYMIYGREEWYVIFDFIERYLKICDDTTFDKMQAEFNAILEDEVSAYRILDGLVVPITNKSEMGSISDAMNTPFEACNIHIAKALELFANREKPDYENSIKESISAVESICSEITGIEGAQATLGKTIKKLKDAGMHIHPAMENAFTSLYGYTSDEGGIRHGSIDFVEAPSEDAKFMLITCSAFVNYLVEKWSKIK